MTHNSIQAQDEAVNPHPDPQDEILKRAIAFAAEKHQGQVRKGTKIPYIVHPMEAAAIVATMTDDREIISAAVLHDTLEDCQGVTPAVLEVLFGARIAGLVLEESEKKQADAAGSWTERKQATIDHLNDDECSQAHRMLTLADKLSNLRAIHRDQRHHGEQVWQRFNQKDKAKQAWYYRSIGDALLSLEAHDAWREYAALLDSVFPDLAGRHIPT
ncbi:MAG: HD domain-containing protein [Christensenellales bacterium]